MEDLLQLFQNTLSTFESSIVELAEAEQREARDSKMDIEGGNFVMDAFHNVDENLSTAENQVQFFELMGDNNYNESLDTKIMNIKMNSVSTRRKDQLFKRHRREQEEKIVQRRKELEQKYAFNLNELKFQGEFTIKGREKNQIFSFKNQDFEKLRPETDLNDTIIDNYLRILHTAILPEEISAKTFIFSTFFMGKLLGDQLRDDYVPEKEQEGTYQKMQKKIAETYPSMKRWIKRVDIFSKEYLVVPINAYKHWNCLIVVSPNALLTEPSLCKIIFLDSMCERKPIFSEAIKAFLQLQLLDRKKTSVQLQQRVPTYQLLVPRQTNLHDCGIYTLCYIEHFLANHEILDRNMEVIDNRCQLKIFPRSIIFTMRELLRQLFKNLLIREDKAQAIQEFMNLRREIEQNSNQADYDTISEKEFKKFFSLNSHMLEDKKKKQTEIEYQCKLRFYLDCEINHYQKDQQN